MNGSDSTIALEICLGSSSGYRSRLRREKTTAKTSASQVSPKLGAPADVKPAAFDPLENFREQEQKAVTWKYPSGPPDEKKLI